MKLGVLPVITSQRKNLWTKVPLAVFLSSSTYLVLTHTAALAKDSIAAIGQPSTLTQSNNTSPVATEPVNTNPINTNPINISPTNKTPANKSPINKSAGSKSGKSFSGNVSWYGPGFQGKKTASGEIFDMNKLTAAHLKLRLGTKVLVEDPKTGKSVIVKVNDRGPYVRTRVMDLAKGAARKVDIVTHGVAYMNCLVISEQD